MPAMSIGVRFAGKEIEPKSIGICPQFLAVENDPRFDDLTRPKKKIDQEFQALRTVQIGVGGQQNINRLLCQSQFLGDSCACQWVSGKCICGDQETVFRILDRSFDEVKEVNNSREPVVVSFSAFAGARAGTNDQAVVCGQVLESEIECPSVQEHACKKVLSGCRIGIQQFGLNQCSADL